MTETNSGGVNYAGFWIWVVAYIIDGIVIAVPVVVISIIFPSEIDASGILSAPSLAGSLISAGIIIAYVGLLESSAKQVILGKMVMGLKVTSIAGTGMVISIIVGIVVFVAGVVVSFTPMKQGLHGMIASTLAIKN
jgi:uncharacterized RDD family membrane protein YckC